MKAEPWPENTDYSESQQLPVIADQLVIPTDELLSSSLNTLEPFNEQYPVNYGGRRVKAALLLALLWGLTIALHLISWGYLLVWSLTGLLLIQAYRIVFASPPSPPEPLALENQKDWPFVSLLVAAKNEETVIANLVKNICKLDYPIELYELWVIDDNSSDQTPVVLQELTKEYPQLKILRRQENATGGKSGALNQVLPLTKGEFLAVFDADAQITPDLLRQVIPLFDKEKVGAVQVRKSICNDSYNFLTRGQSAEMALDSYFQQQRIAVGGIGELRGNGQFMRRSALEQCGGWNEETITDDLDLTIRLHVTKWDIDFLINPAVGEEGVTKINALWHQRNRWAEGGYQRYLDYWQLILTNKMGWSKTIDLLSFMIIQYLLPCLAIPDLLMSFILKKPPITSSIATLTVTLSVLGMSIGLQRTKGNPKLSISQLWLTLKETLRGTIYMFHWFIIVASTNARISVRPKRLKWVKTIHHGA